MFKSLTLTNFRRHENLTLNFESGLIAIRGSNERGKSTVFHAIAYALFGARALHQPLSEVVTWGKPEASLQVELEFVAGTRIRRSKRGCEILAPADRLVPPLVTGQTECTRYIETMLGTNADTAAKLMLASQGALRGALEGGPTEAAALIEHLADFNLIDRVVDLIQEHLPTGNTSVLEASVRQKQDLLTELAQQPVEDLEPYEKKVAETNADLGCLYEQQKRASTSLNELDVAAARRFMVELAAHVRDETSLSQQLVSMRELAEVEIAEPSTSMAQVQGWRAEIMALKDTEARLQAHKALLRLAEPELTWEGTELDYAYELQQKSKALEMRRAARTQAQMSAQAALSKFIREKACAFCGKDLSAVPEVIQRNAEADVEYQRYVSIVDAAGVEITQMEAEYQELLSLGVDARAYETVLHRYAAFIEVVDDRYPGRWVWKGAVPTDGPVVDYNAMIKKAETAHQEHQRALGRREAARSQLRVLEGQAAVLCAKISAGEDKQAEMSERIRQAEKLEREVANLGDRLTELKGQLQLARQELDTKQLMAAAHAQRCKDVDEDYVATVRQLEGIRFNNALVKKVRSARGVISDKLWSVVLASVSHHFSQIRGTLSAITRSENGFRCDGQAVQGLSGSTLDALGLAIRVSLTKTFLPNSRFMLLDEPGAAADDERESNMLGLIAASDFDQTLLITHSALADSFANQVVQL